MSVKNKVFAAAAALTVAGGLGAVVPLSASAATPQCGKACVQIFSKEFGTAASPGFVESVFRGIPHAGVPTILQRTSTSNPAGDMIIPDKGPISHFYAEGMVSAAANRHYGADTGVQVEYAPYGVPSGLCAAIATRAPYQNEGLTLQKCSTPGTTVFVIDTPASSAPGYFPIVLASTRDFTHPFTMTFPGNADPAHRLFPQIKVQHLRGNPTHVPDDQLWGADNPPVS
jgi:hypothetical protein